MKWVMLQGFMILKQKKFIVELDDDLVHVEFELTTAGRRLVRDGVLLEPFACVCIGKREPVLKRVIKFPRT
jgi:hypothetical protein